MKKILLLVTGMSPQIVTETLYGLAVRPADGQQTWVPDEIHVLSTLDGLNQVRDRLFAKGNFAQMQTDYPQLASICFDDNCLHPICDANTQPLTDLKTPIDNEYAANAICDVVRQFTADNHVQLHVSIAGGRKTMGFYAGYALSLYGRADDGMSHVLVDDKFENVPDFYYPTPGTRFVTDRSGKTLNASDAQVWLANIPFVRLRRSLSQDVLVSQSGFSEVVNAINMAYQPLTVTLNIKQQTVQVGDIVLLLAAREFAFYWWFAHNKKQNLAAIIAPSKLIDASEYKSLAHDFLQHYLPLKSTLDTETIIQTMECCMDRGFFDDRKTTVTKKLKNTFGRDVAEKIGICNTERGSGKYGILLEPSQILIVKE
jgi:CRISPR-associated protein (TIGR02584 family)